MSDGNALKNARLACEQACAESKKAGDEMLYALQKADLVSFDEARNLFKRQAERAFVAGENWRKAAEILSGIPRTD